MVGVCSIALSMYSSAFGCGRVADMHSSRFTACLWHAARALLQPGSKMGQTTSNPQLCVVRARHGKAPNAIACLGVGVGMGMSTCISMGMSHGHELWVWAWVWAWAAWAWESAFGVCLGMGHGMGMNMGIVWVWALVCEWGCAFQYVPPMTPNRVRIAPYKHSGRENICRQAGRQSGRPVRQAGGRAGGQAGRRAGRFITFITLH